MRLTDAERWEIRALQLVVENAELRLAIARATHQARVNQCVADHGGDPTRPHAILDDGTITDTTAPSPQVTE